jgi:hypothetical protein
VTVRMSDFFQSRAARPGPQPEMLAAVAFCLHEAVEEAKAGAGKSDAKPAATFAGAAES